MSYDNFDSIRFEEIMRQIQDLAGEAHDMLPVNARERARSYWYAHIMGAVDENSGYLGGSMIKMSDSLDEADNV